MELYAHTQKKEQSSSMPMYHVLEGPTPVESAPETQEQEVCTLYMIDTALVHKVSSGPFCELYIPPFIACDNQSSVTDIPLYSVVDKSKKKKKTTN